MMLDDTTPLRGLTNIGPTIAARLAAVGVRNVGELREIGCAAACARVRAAHPELTIAVCYYLYSLQGALLGCHWDKLPERTKQRLRRELATIEESQNGA